MNLVSIIIPTFNKASLAIETLNSIVAQTYANWECIVVDDGSTKEDYRLLESYIENEQKITLHKRPDNKPKGANACRNYGMAISKGDYIQFFDSDDLMLPSCIEKRVGILVNSSLDFIVFSMGILKGASYVNDTENTVVNNWEEALHAFLGPNRLPWNLQRTLYRADLIKDKVVLNENLKRFQDVEFNIRLLSQFKPSFKIEETIDCIYRKASNKNPRSKQFNRNVYNAVPPFLEAIYKQVPQSIFNKNKPYLQKWLFNIVGLYTSKDLEKKHINKVVKSAKQYLQLNWKQQWIIKILFFAKRKALSFKGVTRLNSFLKNNY